MTSNFPTQFAIISDIHGNLPALEAVLADIDKQGIKDIYCCGDIVGYGANPNECLDIVIGKLKIPTIAGNHDHAAIGIVDTKYFNEIAKKAITWTEEALTEENRERLQALPMKICIDPVVFVHSSPRDPEKWKYIVTMGDARDNFNYFEGQFCFIGHSHHPFIIEKGEGSIGTPEDLEIILQPDKRYLVNVGSVGQPRDKIPKAAYAICDLENEKLEIIRVDYNIALAKKAIYDACLPKELAERLDIGW